MMSVFFLGVSVFFWGSQFFELKAHKIGSPAWMEDKLKDYSELSWLGKKGVRQTYDMQTQIDIDDLESPSHFFYKESFPEFDRSFLSLMAVNWLIKGGKESYEALVSAQKGDEKLSYENFENLHQRYKKLISSGKVTLEDFERALVLGDTGKTETAREYFKALNIIAPDHDDFLKEALQKDPTLFPSFKKMGPWVKKILPQISGMIHFGHFLHLEGGVEMLDPLASSKIVLEDPEALEFDFLVHIADVAGAGGHLNPRSSIVLTQNAYKALQAMDDALNLFKKEGTTSRAVLENYIKVRAEWLGLTGLTREERLLTRVGTMIRLFEKEEGQILRAGFEKFDSDQKELLLKMLDPLSPSLPQVTPTYVPAVLGNLYNNKKLGDTKEERLLKTIEIGLPLVSRILRTYQENLTQGKIFDKNAPLNFNDLARVAKEAPESLSSLEFVIDHENYVRPTS